MTSLNKPYTNNVIINFGGSQGQVEALVERIEAKNEQTTVSVINPRNLKAGPSQGEKDILARVDDMTRIYIIDHCQPNANHIGKWHYSAISEYLAEGVQRENLNLHPSSNLRISLIACCSANGGRGGVESVASKLHYSLARLGIMSEVVGRTDFVTLHHRFSLLEGKYTLGLVEKLKIDLFAKLGFLRGNIDPVQLVRDHHHVPGSKAEFIWSQKGEQLRVDSYIRALAKKTERALNTFQQEEIASLKEVQRLRDLVENQEVFSKTSIKEVINLLEKLESRPGLRKSFHATVAQLLHDAKKSISSNSIDTEVLGRTIMQNDFYKSIRKKIDDDFIFPFRRIAQSLSQFPQKERLIQKLSSISNTLAHIVEWKYENNLEITHEKEFAIKLMTLLSRVQSGVICREGIEVLIRKAAYHYKNDSVLDKVSNYSNGVLTGLQISWSIGFYSIPYLGSSLEVGTDNLNISDRITKELEDVRECLFELVDGVKGVEKKQSYSPIKDIEEVGSEEENLRRGPIIEEVGEEENLRRGPIIEEVGEEENLRRGPIIEEVGEEENLRRGPIIEEI
ncbi:MAG: hypothetical protein WAM28_02905 [Chlamydiales bacterium]